MPVLEYRVKLRSTLNMQTATFNVTPDLSESRTVNYKTVDPIHAPGQIYAYVNSSSRMFQLSGVKLISRTQDEAEANLQILWLLKGWTMPAFGIDNVGSEQRKNRLAATKSRKEVLRSHGPGSSVYDKNEARLLNGRNYADVYGADLSGSPPQVLELSAYSEDGQYSDQMSHINRVPVVITSLNIPYPSDVDYFPTPKGVPMPSIMAIDISLAETHSPKEYENFSLSKFKRGILPGF